MHSSCRTDLFLQRFMMDRGSRVAERQRTWRYCYVECVPYICVLYPAGKIPAAAAETAAAAAAAAALLPTCQQR
jgi:hypothetical protein